MKEAELPKMKPSWSLVAGGLFLAYIGHTVWTVYTLFHPTPCASTIPGECIDSFLSRRSKLDIHLFTSLRKQVSAKQLQKLWSKKEINIIERVDSDVNVTLPMKTLNNGSLYVHMFVCEHGANPLSTSWSSHDVALLTAYTLPQAQVINLMGAKPDELAGPPVDRRVPVTHWRSRLTVSIMTDLISFDRRSVPGEVAKYMRVYQNREYLPLVYIDHVSNRLRDLQPVNASVDVMPLAITYAPISVGKLRMWRNLEESFNTLYSLGFTEKDTDELKGIFADTNFFFLLLTFVVAAVHLLFDFLAFKNDISYWQNRKSMEGLSTRVVVWRCVSMAIIFLYLVDEETSLLVLIPAGIGSVIEVWKVKKALKVSVRWRGWRPSITLGSATPQELETRRHDGDAMRYLSYLLYPLVLAGAVYSLLYSPHKSWYSWCINSLVNGVYAFGFLFMLPQLFVNYRLKSVAHLPWRAFMYKAFNTFIDDVFAFIITMPTAHRLACFRDDVVFVIYLYQRWLYPVDKKRVNEFGQSFDDDRCGDGQTEEKKTQ